MSGGVRFGKPRVLIRPDAAIAATPDWVDISSDGERLLIAVPPPQVRQLTIFDRQGSVTRTVGDPTQFVIQAHFSADGNRLAYLKRDPRTSETEIWTYDLQTNEERAVTRNNWPESTPIWSPDDRYVLYVSVRGQDPDIYRKSWDGTGDEELLFRYTPGVAGMELTDAAPDGSFLTFSTGVVVLVPLAGSSPLARQPIDWLRDEYDNWQAKFSPDGRYVAYLSNPDDPMTWDLFVRPFDAGHAEAPPAGDPVRISEGGAVSGMVSWRGDGRELYYLTNDREVVAVEVSTTPTFKASAPEQLFKLPSQPLGNPFGNGFEGGNVTHDGQRFVFSMLPR
jgi:dipeptidyl aminopeptidase/acylaminoacyl peptidase